MSFLYFNRDQLDSSSFVDERAKLDGTVKIGKKVMVWQFATVIRNSKLEDGVSVSPNAVIDGAHVGIRSRVGPFAFLVPGTLIGDDCFIGPHVSVCNDMWPRVEAAGFDYAKLRSELTVVVGDGASLGARSVILPGVVIGKDAMIAAGSVVDRDVPDFHLFTRKGEIKRIEQEGRKLAMRMRLVSDSDAFLEPKPRHQAFFQMLRRRMGRKTLSWLQKKHEPAV